MMPSVVDSQPGRAPVTTSPVVPVVVDIAAADAAPVEHSARREAAVRPGSIRRAWTVARTTLLVCADLVAANTAGNMARSTRFDLTSLPTTVSGVSGSSTLTYNQLGALLALTWIVVLACVGAHHRRRFNSLWEQSAAILRAAVGLLAVIGVTSLFARLQLSRSYVVITIATLLVCTFIGRLVIYTLFSALMRIGILTDRVLLLGPSQRVIEVRRHLERTSRRRVRVVVERHREDGDRRDDATLQHELLTMVERQGLTSIIVCGPASLPAGNLRSLSAALAGTGVSVVVAPGTTEVLAPAVQIHPIGDLMLLRVRDSEPRLVERIAKQVIDRTLALLALLLGLPVLLAVTIAVGREGRPLLFRQQRVGRGGRPFTIYKFRTMAPDAEERLHREGLYQRYVENGFKLPADEDPRITPTGALLRRTSLDELPQLWNVVCGQMSLVGPRPVLAAELASYADLVVAYTGVKPGVTGYWQINGRSDVGFPERAELDCYYFDHRSLRFDLRILARTVVAVAFRRGAH